MTDDHVTVTGTAQRAVAPGAATWRAEAVESDGDPRRAFERCSARLNTLVERLDGLGEVATEAVVTEAVAAEGVAAERVEAEAAALLAAGRIDELAEEIALVRVILLRLLEYTNEAEGLHVEDRVRMMARVAELVFRGAGVVVELERSRQALQPDPAEELAALIDEVLDELEQSGRTATVETR